MNIKTGRDNFSWLLYKEFNSITFLDLFEGNAAADMEQATVLVAILSRGYCLYLCIRVQLMLC
ncbi:hypothetical protein T4E_9297 [Trichinella pseudospiralis]|uniref:Uncharacterized protein n=1 Tax=Trichinella pseudospiralis TaxID=6337 RepID=A0A0V0XGZ4_TRIPS|nr:hypothetical protein T4E_4680 [Trichinella pseudospiralis]KRX87251.1 hypothetical protein T4E_9297 [Trichinella pseudospiralis]